MTTGTTLEDANIPASSTRMAEWKDSRLKRIAAMVSLPVIYALNRPSMHWFSKAAYDFALRCNGFAINYKGKHGLTLGEEKLLRRVLAQQPSGVLIDVGANSGAYTRMMRQLAPHSPIYAFEPHPTTFEVLRDQVKDPNTTLVNKALSDAAGELSLYDMAGHDGSTQASLSRDAVGLFSHAIVQHHVSVTTLDEFIRENAIEHVSLLKIDTEGFDLAVLTGAANALAQGRIGLIQFEFIPANITTRTSIRDFIEILPNHTVYRLCLNGALLPLSPYDVKRVEVYVTHNLVALPNSTPPR